MDFLPSHVNAQGDYARRAKKLLPGLLPDLTDGVSGRPLNVVVSVNSICPVGLIPQPDNPPASRKPLAPWSHTNGVLVRGIKQRWIVPGTKNEENSHRDVSFSEPNPNPD